MPLRLNSASCALVLFGVLPVVAAGAAFAAPATAEVQVTATVTPGKAGTPARPAPIGIRVAVRLTDAPVDTADGSGTTETIEAKLPYPIIFNPVAFPACTEEQVRQRTCPSRARIGTGRVGGAATGGLVQTLRLTAYNGVGYSMLMRVEGTTPLRVDSVTRGTIRSSDGRYGMALVTPIPANLQQPVPGVTTTVTSFELAVRAQRRIGGRTVSFLSSAGCSGGRWPFAVTATYRGRPPQTGTTTVRCSR